MLDWAKRTDTFASAMTWDMFVGGEWVPAQGGKTFGSHNPLTGELIAHVPDASRADVDAAITAAKKAQPAWEALPIGAKSALFMKAAALFEERKMHFAQALMEETGSGFGKSMFECSLIPVSMVEAAALPTRAIGEIYPSHVPGKINRIVRKAAGVVGAISPWNFPLFLSFRAYAYAIALGNTAVLKPSEDSPLVGGLMLAQLFEDAGFPPGVFNVVTTSREGAPMVGDAFVNDKRVDVISFTGSTKVGQTLATAAAAVFKPTMMELGGKNASIVLEDADIDRAVDLTFFGAFMHQGQICMSTDKILVHRSLYEDFLKKLVAKTAHFAPTPPQEQT